MPFLIDEKRDEIAAACRWYGIERLFIFGSALRDEFRPGDSDLDMLVEFGPLEITSYFHTYLDAREAFRRILQTDVDLVMQGAVKDRTLLWSSYLQSRQLGTQDNLGKLLDALQILLTTKANKSIAPDSTGAT